ncbi:hypothetical protein [Aureispira anguillae]|uniref:Uncharacterized protein n=1 Tax=Aureispira anguillae TaxID=2864201 RepID=A0A916DWK7_9BACT|nr:hypothetical protein [Aureispira anguillae]BDS15576.1 hypothetical protein AsAng_0063600 [Aureispira anguillae]
MKQFLLLFLLSIGFIITTHAQSPQAFQYQAIARSNTGLPIINQAISIRISIIANSPTGAILYVETHAPTTNQFGLFNLKVGQGTVANGTFNTISWGSNAHYLKLEMDETGNSAYQDMGTIPLVSVPYALHAATVDNTDDADADPNNELQSLSINGPNLSISGGNTITLPTGTTGGSIQFLSRNNDTLALSSGGGFVLLNDDNPSNELQTLSINGSNLSLSNGNTITLPTGNTTPQVLSKIGNSISLSNGGGSINLNDDNANNEIQTLSFSGSTLSISGNGGNSVTLPSGGTLDNAYDYGGAGVGRSIIADAGEVSITTASANATALRVENNNTGVGLISSTNNASNTFSAIQANTNSNSNTVAGIIGNTTGTAWGVAGQAAANSNAEAAVYGSNLRTVGGHGVLGVGFNGTVGQTGQSTGFGVYGENFDNVAPLGNGVGVGGKGFYGVLGEDRYLGAQNGAYGVYSNGTLGATGTKTFRIDHPKDPENKYLRHFSIESSEVLNVYRGTTTFDANGNATVELPDYFNSINKNVSYQLTPVGAYMPLYIKEKVNENNQFVVSGGIAGKEVSWAVYAERNDLYMQQNPQQRAVEIEKRPHEKGHYLIPSLYGEGQDKAIFKPQPKPQKQAPMNVMD